MHYADDWKNSDGNEPTQNPNGDKSDILSHPSPDAAWNNGGNYYTAPDNNLYDGYTGDNVLHNKYDNDKVLRNRTSYDSDN